MTTGAGTLKSFVDSVHLLMDVGQARGQSAGALVGGVVEAPSLLAGPIVDADGTIIHHDVRAGNVINRSSARPCSAAAKRVRRAKMVPENTPVFQKNRGKQGVQMSAGYPFRHWSVASSRTVLANRF